MSETDDHVLASKQQLFSLADLITQEFPRRLMIQTSSSCDLSCVFCPHAGLRDQLPQGVMSDDLFRNILAEAGTFPMVERVDLFLMNEPLTDPRIIDRIHQAKRLVPRAIISLTTNGVGIDEPFVEKLLESPLDHLGISVYAHRPETYERLTGNPNFSAIRTDLERAVERIRTTRLDMGINLRFIGVEEYLDSEERQEAISFWGQRGMSPEMIEGHLSRAGLVDAPLKVSRPHAWLDGCGEPNLMEQAHILYDGRVVLCHNDYRHISSFGDCNETSLHQIWTGLPRQIALETLFGLREPPEGFLCTSCEQGIPRRGQGEEPPSEADDEDEDPQHPGPGGAASASPGDTGATDAPAMIAPVPAPGPDSGAAPADGPSLDAAIAEPAARKVLRPGDRDIPSEEAERIPRWLVIWIPLIAAIVASPGLSGQLLSDDYPLLYGNQINDLRDLFTAFLQQSSSLAAGGTYRPLTEVSIGLDYLIWGTNPFGYHLVNLLWHVINSLICYIFVRLLVPLRPIVALTAALIFAVHPVHGDALFWISARSDLICTAFFLISLILFVRGKGGDRRRPTLLSLFFFLLALLSKEVALTLPLLVVILDLAAPSAEGYFQRFRKHIPRYLAYVAMALAYLLLRYMVLSFVARAKVPGMGDALFNLGMYIKLMMMPFETRTGLRGLVVMFLALIVLVVTFMRYARMGDRRNLLLSIAWMGTIVVPMVDVPRRWQLYMPSLGICVFLAIVLAGLTFRRDEDHPKWLSRISGIGLISLLVGGGGLLYYHATVYRTAGDLAQNILAQVKQKVPNPAPGTRFHVANLPSVLTSWAGDQAIFAFGFPEALKLTYGRSDLEARVLSTLYVKNGEPTTPAAWRDRDGTHNYLAGKGAYSFSFHTSHFTTGRNEPREGQTLYFDSWDTRVKAVQGRNITHVQIKPHREMALVLYWDGSKIRHLK